MLGADRVSSSRSQGVYAVHDWAKVHRLHHVQGLSKQAIAGKLRMSRTTVYWPKNLGSRCFARLPPHSGCSCPSSPTKTTRTRSAAGSLRLLDELMSTFATAT